MGISSYTVLHNRFYHVRCRLHKHVPYERHFNRTILRNTQTNEHKKSELQGCLLCRVCLLISGLVLDCGAFFRLVALFLRGRQNKLLNRVERVQFQRAQLQHGYFAIRLFYSSNWNYSSRLQDFNSSKYALI